MDVIRAYARLLVKEGLTEHMFFIVGNGPLRSAKSARWMRDHLYGVIVPDHILNRMETAEDQRAEGIKICTEQIQEIADIDGIAGVHLMAPVNIESVPIVISEINLPNRQTGSAFSTAVFGGT